MSIKCALLLAIYVLANLESVNLKEVLAKCRVHHKDLCHIDNRENPVEIKEGDSIKITIADTDAITTFSIDQVEETPAMIRSIPLAIFSNFRRLGQLILTRTGNTVLRPELFEGGENLEFLSLEQNIINTIPSRVFRSLSNVNRVSVGYNRVETIENNAFDGMEKLRELYLPFNKIRIIPRLAFTGAQNIELLQLTHNQIETIEEGAFNLPNLRKIYLAHNKLVMLSDTLFYGAPNLLYVRLGSNSITNIGNTFNNCYKLDSLFLSDNPNIDVNLLSIASLENLRYLDLENTQFKFPTGKPVRNTTKSKLKKINLSSNNISNPDIFTHLSMFGQLEKLELNNNNFSVLNDVSEIQNYFPYLKRINIINNGVSLCKWIEDNERFLTDIRVGTTVNFHYCESQASKDNPEIDFGFDDK